MIPVKESNSSTRYYAFGLLVILSSCATLSKSPEGEQILTNPEFSVPPNKDGSISGWVPLCDPNRTINLKTYIHNDGPTYLPAISQDGTQIGLSHSNVWMQRHDNLQVGRKYHLYFEIEFIDISIGAVEISICFYNGEDKVIRDNKWNPDVSGTEPLYWADTKGVIPPGCTYATVSAGLSDGGSGLLIIHKVELTLFESINPKASRQKEVLEGGLFVKATFDDNYPLDAYVDFEQMCWSPDGQEVWPCEYQLKGSDLVLTLIAQMPISSTRYSNTKAQFITGGGYNIHIQGSFMRRDNEAVVGPFSGTISRETPYSWGGMTKIPGVVEGYLTKFGSRVDSIIIRKK